MHASIRKLENYLSPPTISSGAYSETSQFRTFDVFLSEYLILPAPDLSTVIVAGVGGVVFVMVPVESRVRPGTMAIETVWVPSVAVHEFGGGQNTVKRIVPV